MRDNVKGDHAEGCDGTCGEVHDKASAYHSVEMSFNGIRASVDNPLTPGGAIVLAFGQGLIKEMRDDQSVPESDTILAAMSTIAIRTCQIAGIVDLVTRMSGAGTGSRLN